MGVKQNNVKKSGASYKARQQRPGRNPRRRRIHLVMPMMSFGASRASASIKV